MVVKKWILLLISFNIFAAVSNPVVDSLLRILSPNLQDTQQVLIYDELSWQLKYEAPDSAFNYAQNAYYLSKNINFEKGKALALHKMGIVLWIKGDYQSALDSTEKALELFLALNDKKRYANTLNNLASIYMPLGNYSKALDLRLQVLRMREDLNDSAGLISSYTNIGNVFLYTKDYKKAMEYYNMAYYLIPKVKPYRKEAMGDVLNNKAVIFSKLNQYDSTIYYYLEYIEMCKVNSWTTNLSKGYMNLGTHYIKVADFSQALNYLLKAKEIQQKLALTENLSRTLTNIGEVYHLSGEYNKAIMFGTKAFNLADSINFLEIQQNSAHLLSDVYAKKGDSKMAYQYLEKYVEFNGLLFDKEKNSLINELEAKYQFEKKEKEIELLRKDALLIENEALLQKQQKYIAIAGAVVFLILLVMAGNRLKLRRKLYQQKEEKLQAEAKYKEEEALRKEEELRANAEINQLNAERIQAELEHRNREITSSALFVAQKNEILSTIDEKLSHLKDLVKVEGKKEIMELKHLIKNNIELDEDWNNFKLHFEEVHPSFFETLTKNYPDLTANEQKICAYLRMNLSGKEIARLLNITPKSTQMSRYRLKKRFNLGAEDDLYDFIKTI